MMMNDNVKPSGKIRKCRISRNKKRYWKKGAQIQDVEDFLCKLRADDVKGISEISNFELRHGLEVIQENISRLNCAFLVD